MKIPPNLTSKDYCESYKTHDFKKKAMLKSPSPYPTPKPNVTCGSQSYGNVQIHIK